MTETDCDRHYEVFKHFLGIARAQVQERHNSSALGQKRDYALRPGARPLRGVIVLLVLIATKCRDSTIRWDAISILRTLEFQEGVFRSYALGLYAQRVVEIEEQRARQIMGTTYKDTLTCEDVPEEARFFNVTLEVNDYDYDVGTLICAVMAQDIDTDASIKIEEHEIVFSEVAERIWS